MTYEIGVRHVYVHGTGAGAGAALLALLCVSLDAEDAQHAEETLAGTAGAEVVAERTVDEKREHQEEDDDTRGDGEQVAVPHHSKVLRSLEQPDGDAHGQRQVEAIAEQLQVALDALWHTHAWQVQEPSQFRHPILRSSQLANPATEEHTQQQNGGQHPLAHVFAVRGKTENQPCHEHGLYQKAQYLDFASFLAHAAIL